MGRHTTPEFIERCTKIDDALTQTNGNRLQAAEILGQNKRWIDNNVNNSQALKERWGRPHGKTISSMDDADALSRDALVTPGDDHDLPIPGPGDDPLDSISEKVVAKFQREDGILRVDGLKGLGLTQAEQEMAIGCQSFYSGHLRHSIEIIGGGVTRSSVILSMQLNDVKGRLEIIRAKLRAMEEFDGPEGIRIEIVKEEKSLNDQLIGISAEHRKQCVMAYQAALVIAKLKTMGKEKKAKVGFQGNAVTI